MSLFTEKTEQETVFIFLSSMQKTPCITQRQLARILDISLGKVNAILRQLIAQGLIQKAPVYRGQQGTKKKTYQLTAEGFRAKAHLTYQFLKLKEKEYRYFKQEWEALAALRDGEVLHPTGHHTR